ncbi:hypothetical protein QUF74_18490 [Candidatus Halobeggiatoa sp. HSG11]|nr:hypothetical protein [Candidatus Halobeggiatoa sp. HSG11]
MATLKKQVSEHPDWFQHEHAQTFDVTQSAISYSVDLHLGLPAKKTFRYEEQDELEVEKYNQKLDLVDKNECIYLDESGIKPYLLFEIMVGLQTRLSHKNS